MITIEKSHPFNFKSESTRTMFESWLEVVFKQRIYKEVSYTICTCGRCQWLRENK